MCVVCIHSWTLRPGSTSITRNGRAVGELPKSRARTIAGWSSAATARASWWNHQLSSGRASLALLGGPQALERDPLAGDEVAAKIDDAHTAPAELADDLVAEREVGADLARRGGGGRSGARRLRTFRCPWLMARRERGRA